MRRYPVKVLPFLLLLVLISCSAPKTFTNPLLPSGADPWTIYKDGYYYYMQTLGDRLVIWKTRDIARLKTAKKRTVFVPVADSSFSKQLWAPELHFIDGKWYIYFAADDGRNEHHRLFVLENPSGDPLKGKWSLKGKLMDPSDKWAIDGSVFEYRNVLYLIWSGWEGDVNGEQDIYISRMANPWTLEGKRVRLSAPGFEWERHGDLHDPFNPPHVSVNEGPEFLRHRDKLFVVYSASGCWTDAYCLGWLMCDSSSNLLDSASWTKSAHPVFSGSNENRVYAPGHNSFFTSPDGTEDWILYHANSAPGQGCGGHRSPRAQKFSWNTDGTPNFGIPVKEGQVLPVPSRNRRPTRKP